MQAAGVVAVRILGAVLCASLATMPSFAARRERLALRHVALDLPGPPSKVIPWDLDGDGRLDLTVVVAYTEIDEVTEERVEEMIEVITVIPAAFDRREVRAYLAGGDGTYRLAGPAMELSPSVLHLEAGPAGVGIVALTDEGLSRLRLDASGGGPALSLEALIEDPPVLARTRAFYATLELVHDLNGDGIGDVMIPSRTGLAVYLGTNSGIETAPSDRVALVTEVPAFGDSIRAWYPLPDVRDINGDAIADLVFSSGLEAGGAARIDAMLGSTTGVFRPLRATKRDCHDRFSDVRIAVEEPELYPWPENLVAVLDLDGSGRAEAVFGVDRSRGDGMGKELKDAKRPIQDYSFHRLDDDLTIAADPYFETEIVGHTMDSGDIDEDLPLWIREFEDLDGDGRQELITVTLDFSIFQVMRILVTKRISIGIDFHVYHQRGDGTFEEVPGLDLSEKLKFDLENLELGQFAQFAGDFDGDGRRDFVHLGRGKVVTIHTGQPGCRYARNPDLAIELDEEPAGLDLIRIEDLDGDGRSDLRVTKPLPAGDPDETAPVRLDLYLSGNGP